MLKDKKVIILLSVVLVILIVLIAVPKFAQGSSSAAKAIEKGSGFTEGSYEIGISSQTDSEGSTFTNPTYKITGLTTGPQHLISISYDNNGQIVNLENVIYVDFDGDVAYIKAAPIMNFLSNTYGVISNTSDIENKWLTIPLPNLANENENYIDDFKSTLTSAMIAFVEAETFEKEGASFIMKKDTGKEFSALIDSVANLLTSHSKSINSNIYNVWSKFTPEQYGIYFNGGAFGKYPVPSEALIDKKINDIISWLNSMSSNVSSSDESYCSLSLSYTDKFQQNLILCVPHGDALETTTISILLNSQSIELTPPEVHDIISAGNSEIYVKGLFESVYTVATSNKSASSQEWYTPKYSTEVVDNVLICTRENELFSESIFYTIENGALSSISVEIQAVNERTYNALLNYYDVLGYQVVNQGADPTNLRASLNASDKTIKEKYANITDIESLQSNLQ